MIKTVKMILLILTGFSIIAFMFFVLLQWSIAKPASAGNGRPESYYADKHCASLSGKREVRMPDGTRADCMTSSRVFEVDFADKWYEAVGQALHYAKQSNKRGAAVIVCRRPADAEKLRRLRALVEFYSLPMDVFSIDCI
jgi:hypothetical protein